MIGGALVALLEGDFHVAGLIGDRIYPQVLPQDPTLPAVTYRRISAIRVRSQDGPSGVARPRYQLDAWSRSYAEADAVAAAVRTRLDGYRGDIGGETIQGAFADVDRDLYDEALRLHGRSADYLVWHEEE